jgi:predicted dehydrogenase
MASNQKMNRREFLAPVAATAALTLVPRHVLGGPGFVPPSDKITLAYIGCGTQGHREVLRLLPNPEVQIVAVCDPEKDNTNYVDWSPTGLRDDIRRTLQNPNWGGNYTGIRSGRDCMKAIIEEYYAKERSAEKFNGPASYEDFRELLEKEGDVDAVKIMTPDHLHGTIAVAAMKKKKHVAVHKPIANRISELRLVLETQKQTGVRTHLLAHQPNTFAGLIPVKQMIEDGAIGALREIHNWTDRPFWPHYSSIPTEVPIPESFNWKLWLGSVPDRPYSPQYTHAVFRGWYEFGGGSIADMGTYSMWPIYETFDLPIPNSVSAEVTHHCGISELGVSRIQVNDFSFPYANKIRYTYPKHPKWGDIVLYWYDGGIRPNLPRELADEGKNLPGTGRMFVGDKGIIVDSDLIPASKMEAYREAHGLPAPAPQSGTRGAGRGEQQAPRDAWITHFRNNTESPGDFQKAWAVTEAINLAGVASRVASIAFAGGNRQGAAEDAPRQRTGAPLLWDAQQVKFTNESFANRYLTREYRDGWKLV